MGRGAAGAVAAVGLVALAACGGPSARAATDSPASTVTTSAARSTRAPTTTTATAASVRHDARAVPAPRIADTGTNYVAIWHSLDRYRMWLEREHPDPALVAHVWVPGTPIAEHFRAHLAELHDKHVRIVDVDDATTARVVSVVDHQVSLLVDETFSQIRLVDDGGRLLDTAPGAVEHFVVLLDRDAHGHWRVASVDVRLGAGTEVDL